MNGNIESIYRRIRIFQPGGSSDSPKDPRSIRVRLDEERTKEKPDFSALFHSALANA